jgi:hypothetical protein
MGDASNCPIGAGLGEPWNVRALELMESDPIDSDPIDCIDSH